MHEDILQPTLSEADFDERFRQLHDQLWCTVEVAFDDVTSHVLAPPKGFYLVDHSFLHDGENWHMYYVTGDMTLTDQWQVHRLAGEYEEANEVTPEPGNGHAVGRTLFDLSFVENVFFESQGRFDLMSRAACSLFRFRDRYGMLYDVRGNLGEVMSLAWSEDLYAWRLDERNPVLLQPSWANPRGAFKDPHIMEYEGIYLIFAVAWTQPGEVAICLITTEDWKTFHDQGTVFQAPPALRGTFGFESPQVILRDGLWHLFYTHGPGLYHSISPSPAGFLSPPATARAGKVQRGSYFMGPFHATELVEDRGQWWLTTDRKEETRRLNRTVGRMCARGSYDDEKTLEEGLYLAGVRWEGDQPVLEKPAQ